MSVDVKVIPVKVIRQRMVFGELQAPDEKIMPLGEKIDAYIELFGSLPLSIRNVLQNLLTRGKIFVEFDDGSNERIELQDQTKLMDEVDAVSALSVYSAVAEQKTVLGKDITQRVMVQPMHKPKTPTFKK